MISFEFLKMLYWIIQLRNTNIFIYKVNYGDVLLGYNIAHK